LAAAVPAVRDRALAALAELPLALSPAEVLPFLSSRLAISGIVAATALALAWLAGRRWSWAPRLGAATALLAILDLGVFHRYLVLAPRALVQHRPEALSLLGDGAGVRLYVYDYLSPGPAARALPSPFRLTRMPEGWTEAESYALGMQMALQYESAQRWGIRGGYENDLRGLHPEPLTALTRRLRDLEATPAWPKVLRMGAVTHAIALHDMKQDGLVELATLPGLFEPPIRVYRVEQPLPRAYAIARARVADDSAALRRISEVDWDPASELLLAEGTPHSSPTPLAASVRVLEERADFVSLEAEVSDRAYVVLVDTFAAGWRATVDGEVRPILRANVAFRTVEVPAGRHVVSFRYEPWSLKLGAGVALAAATLLLTWVVGDRRRPVSTEPHRVVA
jgi:hypothetical protein